MIEIPNDFVLDDDLMRMITGESESENHDAIDAFFDDFKISYDFFDAMVDWNLRKIRFDSTDINRIYEQIKYQDTHFLPKLEEAEDSDLRKIAYILYVQAFVNKRELIENKSIISRLQRTRHKLREDNKRLNSLIVSEKINKNQLLE